VGNWTAVARVVNDRMQERGITQRELAETSGVSTATLRQIQQGVDRQRSRSTLSAVSRALGFPEDHLRDVSLRGRPSDATPEVELPPLESLRAELAELRTRVEAIESRMGQ
jgi:transcriptional regulator with XRE-family HTH domain